MEYVVNALSAALSDLLRVNIILSDIIAAELDIHIAKFIMKLVFQFMLFYLGNLWLKNHWKNWDSKT